MCPNEPEIAEAIKKIRRRQLDGDYEQLSKFVDVFVWPHPASVIFPDAKNGVCLVGENHGPYTISVEFNLSLKGKAIVFEGESSGRIVLRPPRAGDEAFRNWSRCPLRAVAPDEKNDCVCEWRTREGQLDWTATTLVKLYCSAF